MMMKNSHTAARAMPPGVACNSMMPTGRMNVTTELSNTVNAIIPL